jgi:hypothetical protein
MDATGHDHEVVVANVYVGDKWNRVERYHPRCYELVGAPYGPAERTKTQKQVARLTQRSRSVRTERSVRASTAAILDALTEAWPGGLDTAALAKISGKSRSTIVNWAHKSRYVVRLPSVPGSRLAVWVLKQTPLEEAS